MGLNSVRVIGADLTANSNGLANAVQVAVNPGKLFSVTIFNTGPDQYIQIFDLAVAPAAAAVPKMTIKVPADSQGFFDFPNGRLFRTGIWIGNSTTSATYTAGAADCLIDADYWIY